MKKIISIFLICIILMSTVLTAPAHALAVEIIGGSYVAYAILAAALAAAGYTIATSDVNAPTFEAIMDLAGAEQVKQLITATEVLYNQVSGRVFFNWTAQEWATFTGWCNSALADGTLYLNAEAVGLLDSYSEFNPNLISSYYEKNIITSNNQFGCQLGNCTLVTHQNQSRVYLHLNLEDNIYFNLDNTYWYDLPRIIFVSPFLQSTNNVVIVIGEGYDINGNSAQSISDVVGVRQSPNSLPFNLVPSQIWINGVRWFISLSSGVLRARGSNMPSGQYLTIAPTANFTKSYSSMLEWMTDVVITGKLVGDWSGIGNDVINPADGVPVDVSIDPPYQVGVGADSVPDSIDGTIDIPLNRYIETELGPDVIDPYVDFTPWDQTAVPPDDVVPDVRLNPPADVTADPDTPFADDQTYPLDYPTDTATDVPADPTYEQPNTDDSDPNENSNRLKLGPLILSKFPFCLPWDLQHAIKTLVTPGEAPVFTVPIVNERLGINTSFSIDFSFADSLAKVSKWFLSALWVVILILITRKIVWK